MGSVPPTYANPTIGEHGTGPALPGPSSFGPELFVLLSSQGLLSTFPGTWEGEDKPSGSK